MAKRVIDEQALLDAALSEFSSRSYEEASVNKIISSAGIPKGSFYYRFRNKYAIYLHLIRESSRKKWEYIRNTAEPDNQAQTGGDIFDIFLSQAEAGLHFAAEYPAFHRLGIMFSKEKGTAVYRQILMDLGAADDAGLDRLIDAEFGSGNFSSRYSEDFIRKMIKALLFSFDEIFFGSDDEVPGLEKSMSYLHELVQFMKTGLGAGMSEP